MELSGNSIDDILIRLYEQLPAVGAPNVGSRGPNVELLGVSLRLSNPRARLSRSENRGKPFSALGELLWYLSRSNKLDFIEPYIPSYKKEAEDDGTLHGAYGPRLFSMRGSVNQIENILNLLSRKPTTRRAAIQIFNAEDISNDFKEIPCTTTMQFFVRDDKLHMSVTLRSNDAYLGLPHDVFCFTMIQEMMARRLNVQLGEYYQYVGSMHIYDDDKDAIKEYIEEGYHKHVEMPQMSQGDPFSLIPQLLDCEHKARRGEDFKARDMIDDSYWADIIRLLQGIWASGNSEKLDALIFEFENPIYRTYIESRRNMKRRH